MSVDEKLDAKHKAIAAALDAANPTSWIPEKAGDEIVGTLLGWRRLPDREGVEHDVAVLDVGTEHKSVWLLHAALRSQLAKVQPKSGELLGIRFLGKRTSAAGREYADYKVVVDYPVPTDNYEPDWQAMATDDEDVEPKSDDAPPPTDEDAPPDELPMPGEVA